MTSGHGQHDEPHEQPPQWQPPQGQPPQWQPPQGQPPQWQQPGPPPHGQPGPYGPPPGYGYAPMPSPGYGQPPPEPKERPLTVRAGIGAFMASFLIGIGSSVVQAINPQDVPVTVDPQFQQETGIDPEAFAEAAQQGATTFALVVSLFFAAVYLLFIWFAWKGQNWARIVLWVLSGLSLAFTPVTFGVLGNLLPSSQVALLVFQLIATLVGVVLLAMKPSSEWYASEKWRRAMTP
jgi:hypothetical protein